MKHFLLATLLLLGFVSEARPMGSRVFRQLPRKIERIRSPSWKQIAAGGVALGTVVGAYKVADGVQNGMRDAAEKNPEGFFALLSGLTLPLRFVLWSLAFLGLGWIARKIHKKYSICPKNKEKVKNET